MRSVRAFFKNYLLVILTVLALAVAGCVSMPVGAPDAVQGVERPTTEGLVVGEVNEESNTISWKGIPFAKPPVDDLRWKAPQPPEKRSAPLTATSFSEICPQYIDHDRNPTTDQIIQGNEDCLYLNIWRPDTGGKNLPVFFWIHGGGGSIQWPPLSQTDGSVLAGKKNMIVITTSYRLGPMGFFNHPALKSGKPEDRKTDSGNFALLDLIQALSWTKENIASFGGNPDNVTIVGESAGAENVFSLIASPLAKGLFHRAVAQSTVIRPTKPEKGISHVNSVMARLLVNDGKAPDEKAAAALINNMSLGKIGAYLRSKSAADFLEVYPEGKFAGMINMPTSFLDGEVLPPDFYGALRVGNYNKVPVLLGSNKEEAKLFLRLHPDIYPWTRDGSLFREPAKAELYNLAAKYQSEGWKVMGVDNLARILRSNIDQPHIYAYEFLWGAGGIKDSVIHTPINLLLGACHAMEIDFVFGTEKTALGPFAFNPKNRPGRVALSTAMVDYWAHFARTGNPNRSGSGLPGWLPWSNFEGEPRTILLDADFENIKIKMSNEELTEADIEKALRAEPRRKEIQPFWDDSRFRIRSN